MNELIGALGIPGAIAALMIALERGFAFGKQFKNGKNGHGNGTNVELVRDVAALSAQIATLDRDLVSMREDVKRVPEQISRGMSSVAARCEEIIDPVRRQVERIEARLDQRLGGE